MGGLLGAGLVLFLPQFFLPAPLWIAHGVVLGIGCLALAVLGWRRGTPRGTAPQVSESAGATR